MFSTAMERTADICLTEFLLRDYFIGVWILLYLFTIYNMFVQLYSFLSVILLFKVEVSKQMEFILLN